MNLIPMFAVIVYSLTMKLTMPLLYFVLNKYNTAILLPII